MNVVGWVVFVVDVMNGITKTNDKKKKTIEKIGQLSTFLNGLETID